MSDTSTLVRSFAGGEITPEMYGRVDLPKFQTALAECRNFVVLPYGPAENRAGTEHVNEVRDSSKRTRIMPFDFGAMQTFVLEFGEGYIRFHTNGATLLEASKAITGLLSPANSRATVPAHGFATGQEAFVSGFPTAPEINGRFCRVSVVDANTIDLRALDGNVIDSTGATFAGAPTVARVYSIASPYIESELFDLHFVQSADVVTITSGTHDPMELRRLGALNWTLTPATFEPSISAPGDPEAVATVAGAGNTVYRYVVTASNSVTGEESYASIEALGTVRAISAIGTGVNPIVDIAPTPHGYSIGDPIRFSNNIVGPVALRETSWLVTEIVSTTSFRLASPTGAALDTSSMPAFVSGDLRAQEALNDLTVPGNKNTITWPAVAGATSYTIYKYALGLYGYIGQTPSLAFVDNNITADTSRTPPTAPNLVPKGAGKQPRAVGYFEQRRAFGGTDTAPQTITLSRSGTDSNFSRSIPSRDDDAITFKFAAQRVSVIRHIVPLQDLILLTSSNVLRVVSQNSDALTPTTMSVRFQSNDGASMVQPIVTSSSILYGQDPGGRICEVQYSWEGNGYRSADASIFAPHLFDGYRITDMTYARAPNRVGWFVRNDGVLLGLTYVPEQQVLGWHHHDTDGAFESVCAVSEQNEDVLYAVVRRTIGGGTRRFIERFASRRVADLLDCFFVDCGLRYDGRNKTATTVQLTTLDLGFTPEDTLRATATAAVFSALDVGRVLVLNANAADGTLVQSRITITTYVSPTQVDGTPDQDVDPLLQVATARWERAIATFTGLWHLEGKTVTALGDGAVQPQTTVVDGRITLVSACSVIAVGLPYTSDLKTLPLVVEAARAQGQGLQKSITQMSLRVFKSSGFFSGPTFDEENLVETKSRTDEPYGAPPALKTTVYALVVQPNWTDDEALCVRQVDPLPLTAVALAIELAIGG